MLRGASTVLLALAALAALALSGCSGQAPPGGAGAAAPTGMTILGLVQDESFAPIPGAQVAVRMTNLTATTDAGGLFAFTGLALSPYLVDVAADGFLNATLNAEPRQNVSLSFILVPPVAELPPPVVLHFKGNLQCALEAVIITPSCDTVLDPVRERAPQTPDPFVDISTFDAGLNPRWSTIVVDVDFDGHPGLDGLRVTVQGRSDADQLTAYEQYGRFHGSQPFSFRLEPGQAYEDGVAPMPANATALQLEVYPHGHAYHAACVPVFGCPLGAGFAQNVRFDLYVTIFFVEPAPADYTLLA